MKLKYELVTMESDGQTVAVPVGDNADEFHGLIRLNGTGADIIEALKEETTLEDVIKTIEDKYDAGHDEIATAVTAFVDKLREEGFLV